MRANRYKLITVFSATLLFFLFCQTVMSEPPEKPGNPGVPGLLAEISELNDIVATQQETIDQQLARIQELETMLIQLQSFAPVQKTGQTVSYPGANRDDGELQKGVDWPDPRFTDNEDGTVTDNMTGLVWMKNANRFGAKWWFDALEACNCLADDGTDLTDSSQAGDWRLPNAKELQSLVDHGKFNPPLPADHPFTGVQSHYYWTSTTYALSPLNSWFVSFSGRGLWPDNKGTAEGSPHFVWCVRDELSP